MSTIYATLTAAEFAMIVGLSPARVRQLAVSGEIEARKVGRDWLIEPGEVTAFRRRRAKARLRMR